MLNVALQTSSVSRVAYVPGKRSLHRKVFYDLWEGWQEWLAGSLWDLQIRPMFHCSLVIFLQNALDPPVFCVCSRPPCSQLIPWFGFVTCRILSANALSWLSMRSHSSQL